MELLDVETEVLVSLLLLLLSDDSGVVGHCVLFLVQLTCCVHFTLQCLVVLDIRNRLFLLLFLNHGLDLSLPLGLLVSLFLDDHLPLSLLCLVSGFHLLLFVLFHLLDFLGPLNSLLYQLLDLKLLLLLFLFFDLCYSLLMLLSSFLHLVKCELPVFLLYFKVHFVGLKFG